MPLNKPKALLLVNPRSGMKRAQYNLYTIIEGLSGSYDLTVHLTEGPGDAGECARDAAGFDVVICCGGDGTVSQVVGGYPLDEKQPTIGIIPLGTTNDLARALRLPVTAGAAVKRIKSGKPTEHDVATFNGRRFVYVASCGAFTKASYSTPQEAKNAFGFLAYLVEGINELSEIRKMSVVITCDGQTVRSEECCFISVSNSTAIGGGTAKFPKDLVGFSDGKMELLMVDMPNNPPRFTEMITKITTSDFNDPRIHLLSGSHFVIELSEPLEWTVDGEAAGLQKRVEITVLGGAIKIIR